MEAKSKQILYLLLFMRRLDMSEWTDYIYTFWQKKKKKNTDYIHRLNCDKYTISALSSKLFHKQRHRDWSGTSVFMETYKLQNRTNSFEMRWSSPLLPVKEKQKKRVSEMEITCKNSPPHWYPTGRLAILQRLGMLIATCGLTSALLAESEKRTAQRHFGFWPIFFTWLQHLSETLAFWSCAADAQGDSFEASLSGEDFPHSPAP